MPSLIIQTLGLTQTLGSGLPVAALARAAAASVPAHARASARTRDRGANDRTTCAGSTSGARMCRASSSDLRLRAKEVSKRSTACIVDRTYNSLGVGRGRFGGFPHVPPRLADWAQDHCLPGGVQAIRLAGIVDLKDGGFKLQASPHGPQVRTGWAMRWAVTVLMVFGVALSTYLWVRHPNPTQTGGFIGLILFLVGCWFVCFVGFAPPWVKATTEKVSVWGDYGAWLLQRLQRSDLAYIFRGQARVGRYRSWRRAYFLVTRDDTPQITISAEDFADEGMIELAKRLQVPIKGDFTAQVS
jgi:hypothetical protein